jgi:hypothetical protein
MGYTETKKRHSSPQAPGRRAAAAIDDQRPQHAAQLRMAAVMADAPQAKRLGAIQAMAAGGARGVAQRAVVNSAYYTTGSTGASLANAGMMTAALNTLNGLVPTAEANAQAALLLAPMFRSASQNAFVNAPNPTTWGTCVEEQLNVLDGAWTHQMPLAGSRPDYHMNVGGIDLYADLTTPGQAGITGDHITGKLWTANVPANDAVAADVTYTGGVAAPPAPPLWRVTAFAARQHHQAARGIRGDGNYSDWARRNPVIAAQALWHLNQLQCIAYTNQVNNGLAGLLDESDTDDTISNEYWSDEEFSDG